MSLLSDKKHAEKSPSKSRQKLVQSFKMTKNLSLLLILVGTFFVLQQITVAECQTTVPGPSTTFRTCTKPEEPVPEWYVVKDETLSQQVMGMAQCQRNNCTEILQMTPFPQNMYFCYKLSNGLVSTVLDAYNRHNSIILRPDDIWAAIMTQFSFYINGNPDEFRGKFVNFEGKKELEVTMAGTLRDASYPEFVRQMSHKIDENLVDSRVKQWVLPNFSTTTDNDVVSIGVVFMATVKKYFDYACSLMCGIPHVTLEGTNEDWEEIYGRLEMLKEYKLERWHALLEPVIKQFAFARRGMVDLNFWQRIVHYEPEGSGDDFFSGWITVFGVFNDKGQWIVGDAPEGMKWPLLNVKDIPPAIVEVPVKIDNNGFKHNSVMMAGHFGTEIKSDNVTLKPTLGWVIALTR